MKYTLLCCIVAGAVGSGAIAAPPRKKAAPPPKAPAAKTSKKPAPPKIFKPGPMWAVAYSPDGATLAVGGYRRVFLYEAATGAKKTEYTVSTDAIRSLVFSADGTRIAAATGTPGQSGSVVLLDAATGKTVRLVKGHVDTVEAVAFSGNTLLAAANDEKITVTDVGSGKTVGALAEHIGRCLSVAVPKQTREADGGEIWATGGADSAVKIWDARARRVVVNFDQCQGGVWSLASGVQPGMFIAGSGDGKLRQFRVRADNNGKSAAPAAASGEPAPRTGNLARTYDNAHEGAVYAVAVAPDGKRFVSGGGDRRVNVWNVDGGRLKQFSEAQGDIGGVAVSPDSKRVAAASLDGHARVYDMDSGALMFSVDEKGVLLPAAAAPAVATVTPAAKKTITAAERLALRSGLPGGLSAQYFTNNNFEGMPALVRVDSTIDFNWAGNAPDTRIEADNYSVRWTGALEAPVGGAYTFYTLSDDGVRLWVNGVLLIDNWVEHGSTEDTGKTTIVLKAGQRVPIRMEFYENSGDAVARLFWSYPGQEKQIIPAARLFAVPASPPQKKK